MKNQEVKKGWAKPTIREISLEPAEDVLNHCWAASTPAALPGQCPSFPQGLGLGCPQN